MNSKLKFLIIDDEADVADVLNIYILKYFHDGSIKSTTNVFEAFELIADGFLPDIIILDLNMPQMGGIEVVQQLLKINSKLNIIIYSGAIEQFELVNNVQLGIKGLLEKPSSPEELRDEVQRVLRKAKKNQDNFISYDLSKAQILNVWNTDVYVIIGKDKYIKLFQKGDEIDHDKIEKMLQLSHVRYVVQVLPVTKDSPRYVPIDIVTIRTTKQSPCDIFTKSAEEYKKVIPRATPITKEHLKILATKNIKHLFVDERHEHFFTVIPDNILILKINDTELARSERVDALLRYADQKLHDLYTNPTEQNIIDVELLSEQIAKYLDGDREALLDILNLKTEYDAKAHAMNVATLSSSILQFFEASLWNPSVEKKVREFARQLSFLPAMKKNIVLAALLHDLESAFSCPDEDTIHCDKSRHHLDEMSQSIKLISKVKSIPQLVIDIIEQHGERCDGSGPKKLSKNQINPYANILIVVDQYHLYLSQGKTPQESIAELFREKTKYNEAVLLALRNVIVL